MSIDGHAKYQRTSIHGRRLGLDDYESIVGPASIRNGTETATTSSTLHAGGTSILSASAATAYDLPSPSADKIGIQKRIISLTTAAVAQYVRLQAGNFMYDGVSSGTVLTLSTKGASVDLEYVSTAYVQITSRPSTSIASISTST